MGKPNVFMIMPFEEEFFEVFEILKRKLENDVEIRHAGNTDNIQNILVDILEMMNDSDVVIADLTGNNPNVLYELGVAHALNKKVIVITKDELSNLPFDLKSYRAKDYNTHFAKFDELVDFINASIHGAIHENIKFGNPVSDFFELHSVKSSSSLNITVANTELVQERGFLDYLTEISQASEELTQVITSIAADMNIMSEGLDESSNKVQRLKNSGNVNPMVMRIQTREAASYIEEFSKKLRVSNKLIDDKWSVIEKSSNDLVENKYASTADNLPGLKGYLLNMRQLDETITSANNGFISMRASALSLNGIEGSLNQASKFLVDDLTDYLNITTQMQSSISRLLVKSKAMFGELE